MKNLIFTTIACLLFAGSVLVASPVDGKWYGKLEPIGLRLAFDIHSNQNGQLSGTFDSPDQGAKGLPLDSVTVDDDRLTLESKRYGFIYNGELSADHEVIEGHFSQGEFKAPLRLEHKEPDANERPQEPHDHPYTEEAVLIPGGGAAVTLAGTLTMPLSSAPKALAILISGSGPQDRDESIFGHRPFLVIADFMARHGIATLRYDDRGVGQSTGNFGEATTADFVADARAALDYLHSRADLSGAPAGLIGHSEGAIIASMVANSDSTVSFVCLLAAPGVPMDELLPAQIEAISASVGQTVPISQERSFYHDLFVFAKKAGAMDQRDLEQRLSDRLLHGLQSFYPDQDADAIAVQAREQASQFSSPWFRYILQVDPAKELGAVACPVLVISGMKDLQVLPSQNLPPLKQTLENGGNPHWAVYSLPGLNHLLQHSSTGAPIEYASITETISPLVLQIVEQWISAGAA